ncbi:SRPBCC domain-containing protein [Angustibacter aerolatus]
MVPELWRAGRATGVRLERRFAATPTELWACVADGAAIGRWLGADPGDVEVLRAEPPSLVEALWAQGALTCVLHLRVLADGGGSRLQVEQLVVPDARAAALRWQAALDRLDRASSAAACPVREVAPSDAQQAGRHRAGPRDDDPTATGADVHGGGSTAAPHADWWARPARPDERFGLVHGDLVSIERRVPAAPLLVWRALTTADGLAGWFGVVTGRLRDGGRWQVAYDDGHAHGAVRRCRPGELLETTYGFGPLIGPDDADDAADGDDLGEDLGDRDDPDDARSHQVRVQLAADPDGSGATLLRLEHRVPHGTGDGLRAGLAAGWWAHLRGLADALAGEPGAPHWADDLRVASLVHQAVDDAGQPTGSIEPGPSSAP